MTWRPLQTVRTRQRRPRHHVTVGAERAEEGRAEEGRAEGGASVAA